MKEILALFVVLGLFGSCKKDPPPAPVTPVPRPMPGPGQAAESMQGAAAPSLPPPPMPTGAELMQWDLPPGWSVVPGKGMRVATFKSAVAGKVDISLIRLPGEAGGELANVNRWRGQINLAPLDEAARLKTRKPVKSKAGEFSLYDFASTATPTPQRMVAGLLFVDGNSWFVKMTGDAGPVGASVPAFEKLVGSLRFPTGK